MNINQAREQVVNDYIDSMNKEKEQDLFASHVTVEMKKEYFDRILALIEDIKSGKLDNNFTVWQRMNTYMTGNCEPLFSK